MTGFSKIGDIFPFKDRLDKVRRDLRSGVVIRCRFDGIGHPKFFVLLGADGEKFHGVFINSEISPKVVKTPSLNYSQIEIGPDDYSFLDHLSYIDCAGPRDRDIASTVVSMIESPSQIRGHVTQLHLTEIRRVLSSIPTVKRKLRPVLTSEIEILDIEEIVRSWPGAIR
jgi:hypothetical protein